MIVQNSDIPFNVRILELTPKKLFGLKPVRSNDIFDGATGNLNEDGLFSISIFGKPGDERRSLRFSYIDIKLPIFHPIIYFALIDLKKLYGLIMEGKEYAIWSEESKDFVKSNVLEGETGFQFFLEHWKKIEFKPSKSDARIDQVKLIETYKDVALTDKIAVIPAGLRDIEVGDDGRVRKDEVNDYYSIFISISKTISDINISENLEFLNPVRVKLQSTFNNLYLTLEGMIKGKHKLFLSKWASRKIQNGTRNVVTAQQANNQLLDAPGNMHFNSTVVGLYQAMKAALPITRYELKTHILQEVFYTPDAPVHLVDKETLHRIEKRVSTQVFDRWNTDEGLDRLITAYAESSIRHNPIIVDDCYLCLIYKGLDSTYKIIHDIDEVPEGFDRSLVFPITWTEFFYLSVEKKVNTLPAFVTRYPITGIGSIYPSLCYLKTTTVGEKRIQLDDSWEPDEENIHYQFPVLGGSFVNTVSPHSSRLSGLSMDFDGDKP